MPQISQAFMPADGALPTHTVTGSLAGLSFGVKDLIDIAGWRTGGGNPQWLTHAQTAASSAPCVTALLEAGAECKGKTISDELAFSLEGANEHYGTPINPLWPECLPGGSSSGSASAVALKEVDFALGTDTGGSVRIPAAWCGLYGLRPSHNALTLTGVIPFSPSYDCVGWLARNLEVLTRVSHVLLPGANAQLGDRLPVAFTFFYLEDVFAMASAEVQSALLPTLEKIKPQQAVNVFGGEQNQWLDTYATIQGREIWQNLGDRIREWNINFGEAIAPRFSACADIAEEDAAKANKYRQSVISKLAQLFPKDAILVFPTAPCLPLSKSADSESISNFYQQSLCINAIAGHAGLPQLTVPIAIEDKSICTQSGSVGLSFIAHRDCDHLLLEAVNYLHTQNII